MNIIVLLSLISLLTFLSALPILFHARKKLTLNNRIYIPLMLSILLYSMIAASNVVEHTGISNMLDPVEDLAEVLFSLLFLFFIYSWKNIEFEQRFQQLFKKSPVPFAELTRSGKIVQGNELMETELEKGFGISIHEGITMQSWWQSAFKDTVERDKALSEWYTAAEQAKKAGTVIQPQEREMCYQDGSSHVKIIGGSSIGNNMLLTLIDISEFRKAVADREKLQQQLMQSQKLEAVGTLAGGIAHDFNNILGAIIGYADMTLEDLGDDSPVRINIERIIEAAQRSASLSRQLLVFARNHTTKTEVIDINHSVQMMMTMLQRLIGENIVLTCVPYSGEDKCTIKIDPVQFDQVLVNLCVNARDAIDDVGRVTITTECITFDEQMCKINADSKEGEYVRLSVADDGCGMDLKTKKRIFEPFFTTKDVGKGTGLGLSTVYGILKQRGGFINCYSEEDIGTRFDVYFPIERSEARNSENIPPQKVPTGSSEKVLIIDDDSVVLEMSAQMLRTLNYDVLPVASAEDAIAIIKQNKNIDLVLTDVIMPHMNGRELYEQLRTIQPELKCLFMSGYTADVIIPKGMVNDENLFIQKPFSRIEIAYRLRDVLENG